MFPLIQLSFLGPFRSKQWEAIILTPLTPSHSITHSLTITHCLSHLYFSPSIPAPPQISFISMCLYDRHPNFSSSPSFLSLLPHLSTLVSDLYSFIYCISHSLFLYSFIYFNRGIGSLLLSLSHMVCDLYSFLYLTWSLISTPFSISLGLWPLQIPLSHMVWDLYSFIYLT